MIERDKATGIDDDDDDDDDEEEEVTTKINLCEVKCNLPS
jgi:hypothetical protein